MFLGLGLRFGGSGVAGAGGGGGGGGYSLDSNLPTPTLSLAVGKTTYPPQFSASFTGGFYAGDQIEFWSAASYAALATAMASTGTLLDDDDDNGLVDATLSGIASGLTYAAVRLRLPSNSTYGPTSNIILHGDATAPTLTSSTSTNVDELQTVLYTATFDELVNTPTLSGTDAALLSVSGSSPATSYTIVLATGLQLDYETQTSYSFSIAATDLAGNALGATAVTVAINNLTDVPTAFTFTDNNAPTASTLYTSNTITVAGTTAALVCPGTFSGSGEYQKNGGSWVTTSPFTFVLGDTFAVRHTSSSDGSAVDSTLNLNGTSNTFTTQIPELPAAPEFQFEADDLTTLFKEIAGSTAVTTSGDTVGKWTDKSGNAIHIVAPADTAVRPLYDLTSGVHSVVGNATNSTALSSTTIPAMWQAGSWTIVLAIKANPAISAILVSEGDSASNNTLASYIRAHGTTASSAGYSYMVANDGVTNLTDPSVVLKTGVFDNNYRVFIVSDDGTGLTTWLDGVKTAKITSGYNRGGGSITVNRFSIFARRRVTFDRYFTGQVQLAVGYNYAFSDAEAAQATTYAALKQGRTL